MPDSLTNSDIVRELYNKRVQEGEVIFTYFGWAGIILRTKKVALALDIGKKCIKKSQIISMKNLDLHFYSHTHWDHFNSEVAEEIFAFTSAPVIAEPQVISELKNKIPENELNSAISGKTIILNGFEIEAVSGIHPIPITLFRVKWDECSFFHGADSDYVPLKDYAADFAFIPTGTPSPSCSPEKALKMVLDVEPKIVIAMHGTKRQMEKFRALVNEELSDTTVIIPIINKLTKFKLSM